MGGSTLEDVKLIVTPDSSGYEPVVNIVSIEGNGGHMPSDSCKDTQTNGFTPEDGSPIMFNIESGESVKAIQLYAENIYQIISDPSPVVRNYKEDYLNPFMVSSTLTF